MAQSMPDTRFAVITQGVAGTTLIVAAVAGKKVVVDCYSVVLAAAGTVKFQSNATDVTGAMDCAIAGGVAIPAGSRPLFETAVGEALNMVTTGGAGKGHLTYHYE